MTANSVVSPSSACWQALSFLISPPDATHHFERVKEGSCVSRVFHFCVGAVESVPVLGAGISLAERAVTAVADTCLHDRRQRQMRRTFITNFWKEHICDFKILHGTSSLYQAHFKKYGISSTYPEAMHSFILKIRKVWTDHEKDVLPKTGYFREFEKRYDEAARVKKVAVHFSANPRVTEEFTSGARGYGGELFRELGQFLRETHYQREKFNSAETEALAELEALIDVMKIAPSMIVKARLTNASDAYIAQFPCSWLKHPDVFVSFVESRSKSLLLGDIIDFLQKERNQLEGMKTHYEFVVRQPIPPSELEFEILPSRYPNFPQERLSEHQKRWLQAFNVSL